MAHTKDHDHVCPWWMGYFLASPIRRLRQDPKKILIPFLKPGMHAVDVGCAMGFFTLDMARIVGPTGRVVGVDLQPRMLRVLERRAQRRGLLEQIDVRQCGKDSLGLDDLGQTVDFVLAMAVVHEVPDARVFFTELRDLLKPGALLLFAEPCMVQDDAAFDASLGFAVEAGFTVVKELAIKGNRARLLS